MSRETVRYEGRELSLLPFSFLDKVGSAIYVCFGKEHDITRKMYAHRGEYGKRGIFYITTKLGKEPAFGLTTDEIEYLRESYSKSQEIF